MTDIREIPCALVISLLIPRIIIGLDPSNTVPQAPLRLSISLLLGAIAKLPFGRQEGARGRTQKDSRADQSAGGIELEIFHGAVSITKGPCGFKQKLRGFNVENQSLQGEKLLCEQPYRCSSLAP